MIPDWECWEKAGEHITKSYRAGYDALTSDWVEKYANIPIDLVIHKQNSCETLLAEALLRDGTSIPVDHLECIPVDNESHRVICTARFTLSEGNEICIISTPIEM